MRLRLLSPLLGLLFAAAAHGSGTQAQTASALSGLPRIELTETEAVQRAYAEADAVFERHPELMQRPDPSSPGWREVEQAAARVWAAGGEKSTAILKGLAQRKDEGGIKPEHARLMWVVRNRWLMRAVGNVARRLDVDVALLDSGTEGSVENDVDKTVRIVRRSDKARDLDEREFNRLVREEIKTVTGGLRPAQMDIELFSGEHFYPRWWEASEPRLFKARVLAVQDALSRNDAAYVTDAEQKMQVIRRAQEKDAAVRPQGGAAVVEIKVDAEGGVSIEPQEDWVDAWGLSGNLEAHDAAGAAVDNLLKLTHKLGAGGGQAAPDPAHVDKVKDDLAKYLARNLLDTATVLDVREGRPGRREPGDYPSDQARLDLVARLTGLDLKDPEQARRLGGYALSMEIAQDLLANKKQRAAGKPEKPDAAVFERLAWRLAGSADNYRKAPEHWTAAAKSAYAELSVETTAAVLSRQFPTALGTWLKPDPALVRRAQRFIPPSGPVLDNQNIRLAALPVLLAAYRLKAESPEQWQRVKAGVEPEMAQDLENLERMLDWGRAKGRPPAATPDAARGRVHAEAENLKQGLAWLRTRFPVTTPEGKLFSVSDEDLFRWSVGRALADLPVEDQRRLTSLLAGPEAAHAMALDPTVWLRKLASLGSPDSLLGFAQTWQQSEGQPLAQRKALLRQAVLDEIIGQLPYYGAARGMWRAAEAENAPALMQIVTAWLEERGVGAGLSGPVVAYVEFSKKLVSVVGHEIFVPLRKDYVDIVYQGYLDPSDAGLLRAGRKLPEGFQITAYPPLLSRLPMRYAFLEGEILDRLLDDLERDAGAPGRAAYIALVKEVEAAHGGGVFVDLETDWSARVAELRRELVDLNDPQGDAETRAWLADRAQVLAAILPQWERQAALARALRERAGAGAPRPDPRLDFELRRQQVYAYFHARVDAVHGAWEGRAEGLAELYRDLEAEDARLRQARWNLHAPTLAEAEARRERLAMAAGELEKRRQDLQQSQREAVEQVALQYVQQWVGAGGDFKDADENLALKWVWHDLETRQAIAARLADDFARSQTMALAAEAQAGMLRGLREVALDRAERRHAQRLAMAAERALPGTDAATADALADALARPPSRKPEIGLTLWVMESRGPDGAKREDLVADTRVVSVPADTGDDWGITLPRVERVSATRLPPEELARRGVKAEQVAEALAVSAEFMLRDPAGGWRAAAASRRYLVALKPAPSTPPPVAAEVEQIPPALRLVALKPLVDGRSRSVRENFDGHGVSGSMILKLALPDAIPAGTDFRVGLALDVAGRVKPGSQPGKLEGWLQRGEPVTIAPGPDGRFSLHLEQAVRADFRERIDKFGDVGLEWNYWYDAKPDGAKPYQIRLRYLPGPPEPGAWQDLPNNTRAQAIARAEVMEKLPHTIREARNELDFNAGIRVGGSDLKKLYSSAVYDIVGETLAQGADGTAAMTSPLAPNTPGTPNSSPVPPPRPGASPAQGILPPVPPLERASRDSAPPAGGPPTRIGAASPATTAVAPITRATPVSSGPLATPGPAAPAPWDDPRIQALMDHWLETAIPPSPSPDIHMRYTEWAQPLSQAARSTGHPDLPAGWTRYRYLWERRDRLSSANLCSLGEYIERNLAGRALADCKKGVAAADSTASVMPGLLGLLDAVPASQWLPSKPAMNRAGIVLLVLNEPASGMAISRTAFDCFMYSDNYLKAMRAQGYAFAAVLPDVSKDGRPARQVWAEVVQGFQGAILNHPLVIDSGRNLLPALAREAQGDTLVLVGPDGRVQRSVRRCGHEGFRALLGQVGKK